MDFKANEKAIKIFIPALFIAMKRKDTPLTAKVFAGITVAYALSPLDLIPDFIPVLGLLDDLLILPFLAALAIKFIPEKIMAECKAEAAGLWQEGKPKKWYYGIPIVACWILIIVWFVLQFAD